MKKKKVFKKIGLALLAIYLLVIAGSLILFKPVKNPNPLPPYYKKGVYHVHSLYSDGQANIDDIMKAAQHQSLDFLILTDHGRPNMGSSSATRWDKSHSFLVIGGSEFSMNDGHMVALGYSLNDFKYPPEAQEAINEINQHNGMTIISHPFDSKIPWQDWSIHSYNGLELISLYAMGKSAGFFKLISFPVFYLFNSNLAFLSVLRYPYAEIKKWDEILKEQRCISIFALDAHGLLEFSHQGRLPFPSYQSLFATLTLYLKLNKALDPNPNLAARMIIQSLKKGSFFNVIEALAPANGFDCFFLTENNICLEMGDHSDQVKGHLVVKLPFSFSTDIKLIKDGRLYKAINQNTSTEQRIAIKEKGVYRLEIYISNSRFDEIPWIISNPFYIGIHYSQKVSSALFRQREFPLKDLFHIEKNNRSLGDLIYFSDEGHDQINFRFRLKKDDHQRDFWAALVWRQKNDFSDFNGFFLDARSDRPMRFWVEIRTKTGNESIEYRHSFLTAKEWQKLFIPLAKFYPFSKNKKTLDAKKIEAVIISINNSMVRQNTSGTLYIRNFGLTRK